MPLSNTHGFSIHDIEVVRDCFQSCYSLLIAALCNKQIPLIPFALLMLRDLKGHVGKFPFLYVKTVAQISELLVFELRFLSNLVCSLSQRVNFTLMILHYTSL